MSLSGKKGKNQRNAGDNPSPDSRNWQAEEQYRQDLFPDVSVIRNKLLTCTSCGHSVKDLMLKGKPIIHPYLETLMCERCRLFYGDGVFSVDEDGSDRYCKWCGQGGTLFICSKCTTGFCKTCIRRNVSKKVQSKLKHKDWLCYCCDTTPLYKLRALCWAAQQYAMKLKGVSYMRRGYKKPHPDSDCSESDEGTKSKKKRKVDLRKKSICKSKKNGDDFETGSRRKRRLLRKKNSKYNPVIEELSHPSNSSDTLPSGLSRVSVRAVLKKLSIFVADITGITKATHKSLLEFKRKELIPENCKSAEAVMRLYDRLGTMVFSLLTTLQDVSKISKFYVEKWSRVMIDELLKAKENTELEEEENNVLLGEHSKSTNNQYQSTKLEVIVISDTDEEERNKETCPTNEQTPIENKWSTTEASCNVAFTDKKAEAEISDLQETDWNGDLEDTNNGMSSTSKKAPSPSSSFPNEMS